MDWIKKGAREGFRRLVVVRYSGGSRNYHIWYYGLDSENFRVFDKKSYL
mgnify:CR=1 FL=1